MQESFDAVDKWPDRLVGAAWINPYDSVAVEQIYDAVNHHGYKAVKLHPLMCGYLPNDECVFPIAEAAGKLDIPLMIHTGHHLSNELGNSLLAVRNINHKYIVVGL